MFGINDSDDQAGEASQATPTDQAASADDASSIDAASNSTTTPSSTEESVSQPPAPENIFPKPGDVPFPSLPTPASSSSTSQSTAASNAPIPDDLIQIKQQALQSLTPLVDHLDQPPPQKFKTMMMLIQASDNSGLVKEAFEVANQITDEKERAQALMDVVNEINYFTQQLQAGETTPKT